jgi:TetR/AcrR family transcriptional regulator, cholesterol catabolism regulator
MASTEGIDRSRPRSAERFQQRREEIVDIAARVFAEHGYHATSIDDLIAATGLQRGGLYHYIGGKQQLLVRIHERFIEPLLASAREIAARGEPPDVELRLLAEALAQDIADYRDQVTVFLHEWRFIEDAPEWRDVRRARKEFEQIIASCIRRGAEAGVFRAGLDERTTMRGFLGMINYTYQWLNPRGRTSPMAVADSFVDIFLRGILASPERAG